MATTELPSLRRVDRVQKLVQLAAGMASLCRRACRRSLQKMQSLQQPLQSIAQESKVSAHGHNATTKLKCALNCTFGPQSNHHFGNNCPKCSEAGLHGMLPQLRHIASREAETSGHRTLLPTTACEPLPCSNRAYLLNPNLRNLRDTPDPVILSHAHTTDQNKPSDLHRTSQHQDIQAT